MNKSSLIDALSAKANLTENNASEVVNMVMEMEQDRRKVTLRNEGSKYRILKTVRKVVVAAALTVAFVLVATTAVPVGAQTYPTRPIHLILPYPPGGATDVIGRIVSQLLGERLGQPLVPENRPGAAANIGSEIVARAKPDGYTILLGGPALTISPSLYKKLNYDPIKDLMPITPVVVGHYVLIVRPSLPVQTLKQFIEYAKVRPGKLSFGSGGMGSPSHLAGELFRSLAGLEIVHVPYKGVNQAMIGMMSNEIDMVVMGTTAAVPQIKAGKVRPLAVLTEPRLPYLPDVPTAREAGIANYEVLAWNGLLAPAGTPSEIIARVSSEWAKVAFLPDTKEKIQKAGFEPMAEKPEKFGIFIKDEVERWRKVVKEGNISAE
ncbi:MAG: tripartite tricarboxylate transporter substrate-binding protein [Deltaproteobacteria bacterium]